MRVNRLLQGLLWLAYPLAVYFGLQIAEPRVIALLLGILLLVRKRHDAAHAGLTLLAGLTRVDQGVLLALLALATTTAATNSELLLRLYPCAVNLGMLLLFANSLRRPPPMVERFARLRDPNLPPEGVRYTRRVTEVWCAFFLLNGSIATWTAFFATRAHWALYNGLIAYLLMGTLFAGEWLVRRHLIRPSAPRTRTRRS